MAPYAGLLATGRPPAADFGLHQEHNVQLLVLKCICALVASGALEDLPDPDPLNWVLDQLLLSPVVAKECCKPGTTGLPLLRHPKMQFAMERQRWLVAQVGS